MLISSWCTLAKRLGQKPEVDSRNSVWTTGWSIAFPRLAKEAAFRKHVSSPGTYCGVSELFTVWEGSWLWAQGMWFFRPQKLKIDACLSPLSLFMYNQIIHPYFPPPGIFFSSWWQGTITLNFYLLGVVSGWLSFPGEGLCNGRCRITFINSSRFFSVLLQMAGDQKLALHWSTAT